jgi:hypothetical protein
VTYTRCIDTIDSPNDEHRGVRNMYRIERNIHEKKIVHEVGYLQEPNRKFTFMGPVRILLAPFSKILELCK